MSVEHDFELSERHRTYKMEPSHKGLMGLRSLTYCTLRDQGFEPSAAREETDRRSSIPTKRLELPKL